MSLAFHTLHYSPLTGGSAPLLEVVAATATAGFQSIGLDVPSIDAHLAQGGRLEEVADSLAAAQLDCTDLAALFVTSDEDAMRSSARRIARLAEVFHPPWCVVSVPEPLPPGRRVAVLSECASIVADAGMRLAVEFSPKGHLPTLQAAGELCDAIGWDRASVVLDALHFFRAGTSLDELAGYDAAQIAQVQFNDVAGPRPFDLAVESRCRRLLPGAGDLPLAAFVDAVRRTGFAGPVVGEVLSDDLRALDPLTVARLVHDALLAYWT